jgi:hypothetical protein
VSAAARRAPVPSDAPKASRRIPMVGRTFALLTVVERIGTDRWGDTVWLCRCLCGATHRANGNKLRRGDVKSCGCMKAEWARQANTTHGASARGKMTAEYRTWQGMIDRCESPGNEAFCNYGGRGITVAPEWRHDFPAFLAHIGPRPGSRYTVERIDNGRGYEPGNVVWATRREQNRNKRNNRWITVGGITRLMADWARQAGVSNAAMHHRLRNKWPIELAVTAPPGTRRPKAA